jgi:hypothetical protein
MPTPAQEKSKAQEAEQVNMLTICWRDLQNTATCKHIFFLFQGSQALIALATQTKSGKSSA